MGLPKGPRAKLARAQSQVEALYDELLSAIDPEADTLPVDFDSQRQTVKGGTVWTITAKVGGDIPRVSDDFSLQLGEALHNFRGALDHTVWWLVNPRKAKLSTKRKKLVQFPMAASQKSFRGQIPQRLPGVPTEIVAVIERYQPYKRSMEGRAIRFLRDLTDLDKHRSILISPTYTGYGDFELSWEGGLEVRKENHTRVGQQIKRGTKISTLVLACPDPFQPKVAVKGRVDFAPAFPRTILRPYADRIPIGVGLALHHIAATCEQVLSEIEALL
jgi:hypothetical protein